MNFFSNLYSLINEGIQECATTHHWGDINLEKLTLEPPKDSSHGDVSTNAALILSKQAQMKPFELASLLKENFLKIFPQGTDITIAGPGFINFKLPRSFWVEQLGLILEKGKNYGPTNFGQGKKVHVEFVSANPTGPMHTGHSRNAVLGDAIASVLEAVGYNVHREFYINDAGNQLDALARSVYLRYLQLFGKDIPETSFEGLYPAEYVIDLAKDLKEQKGDAWVDQDESLWIQEMRLFAVREIMEWIKRDLHDLGVHMDTYTSEAALVKAKKVDHAVQILTESDDVYIGTLEPPKGHVIEDFEARPQTLFRSTKYGDTVDRPLKKSDGSWTYFAPDIAYHLDKYERGFDDMIDILSVDHSGYITRIESAVRAVTKGKAKAQVLTYKLVNFMEDGKPVRMSKRAGNFVTLRDLIDRVGKDVVRFMMLTRHPDMSIDFDFVKVQEHSKENPVFYVHYAHARICSVLRHAKEALGDDLMKNIKEANFSLLCDDSEKELIKVLASYPRMVEIAAHHREPHRIAYYLYDVAAHFHSLWNKGKEHTQLRFIDLENKQVTFARLGLIMACKDIIAQGLKIFKIDPMEEMR